MDDESPDEPPDEDGEVSIASKIPYRAKREIRVRAAMDGDTMSKWVRAAIMEKLEREADEGNERPRLPFATAD